ncbi:MAG: L-histidine N(alpha)-methyltransferase [Cyclobacteriaceae bacterium]|nr:L-histidine N(alpha)-methyltransferase [Cyclobacteriaceae bacterium]
MDKQFAEDVRKGLSAEPKYLHSKYFYNENGDRLFQKIMELDEYYLTNSEYDIFENQKSELLEYFSPDGRRFDLIELGAGDGYKTIVLISYFLQKQAEFTYIPVDISRNVLKKLSNTLTGNFPSLEIHPVNDEYFHALEELNKVDFDRKVILFLGSNIGNFREDQAILFLSHLAADMTHDDRLLIGFDLKKDPDIILNAYNDREGVTRDFNLNLLTRINEELDGDFDLTLFKHYPTYNPQTGETVSYLVSMKDQHVRIGALDEIFHFNEWEPVFMEVSQKYSLPDIERLAVNSGFSIEMNFFDKREFFTDSLWVLK